MCVGGFVGYKGIKFFQEKYHFLRENIVEVNDKLDKHISTTNHYDFDYSWIGDNITISHGLGALGSTKSKIYSNSLNAFETNYELGQRIFEADFDITEDLVTVCSHDEEFWRYNAEIDDSEPFTYENFMNSKIYTKYEPLDYKGIIDLLNKYEDAYIITDTKYYDKESVYLQFSQIVNYAKQVNPEILDRIIPQIYTEDMLGYVMNTYPFKSMIYTLYQTQWTAKDVAEFCIETGIKFVTASCDAAGFEDIYYWNAYGINVATHTINDVETARGYLNNGTKMIYTDVLLKSDFGEN